MWYRPLVLQDYFKGLSSINKRIGNRHFFGPHRFVGEELEEFNAFQSFMHCNNMEL